jgi:pimeloyl-ACP methyl ester carboxylesterase
MAREQLLLIPGLMCDQAVWQPVLPALEAVCDCQVADPGAVDDLSTMAATVLQRAPPRFALAGHSMGARIALEVLRQAPDRVSRIALLDTGYLARAAGAAGDEEARKRQALLDIARTGGVEAMARVWVQGMVHPARLDDAALIDAIVAMFVRRSADTFACQIRALLQRPDGSAVLRAIDVPALMMCGRQDSWAPVAQHAAMHVLAPVARLAVVEDAGHMAPMERPDAVAAELLRWLEATA